MFFKRLFYIYSAVYLLLLFIVFTLYSVDDSVSYPFHVIGLLILLLLFFIKEFQANKNLFTLWVKPSNIFLLSFIIVNFQIIISAWLEYETIGTYLETSKYSGYMGKVLYLGLIGMIAYLIGYSYSYKNIRVANLNIPWHLNSNVWATLSLVAFVMFVINIDIISFLTGMDYEGSGAADRETTPFAFWETLFDTFMTITIALTTKKFLNDNSIPSLFGYIRSYPIYFLFPVLIYLLLRLVSGDRGPVLYTGLMFFFSYLLISKRKIKLSVVLPLLFVGAFGMTLLNLVRNFRNTNQTFTEKVTRGLSSIEDDVDTKSISPFTYELAKSVNCNFIAVHDIEEGVTNYKYGLYNFCEIASAVPGLNRITTELFDLNLYRTATSEYVTISYLGENYMFGLGTTAITDFYLDLGLLGVILGMILVGIVYRRIDINLLNGVGSLWGIVFFLKFASMAVYIPRASFSFVLCRVLYIMIFFTLINTSAHVLKICLSKKGM